MPNRILERLAVPGVVLLVSFLAFTSQYLFHKIEPGQLSTGDIYWFNGLVTALLVCYLRTCFTDPGKIPSDWCEHFAPPYAQVDAPVDKSSRQRYCRKCEMPKPPRAHHCKTCNRLVFIVLTSRSRPLLQHNYLGPSVHQLAHLFVLTVTNSFVLFALTLLLGRTIWDLGLNMTTIEGWEVERHEALRRRARVMGGYLEGANGEQIRIDSQEFPWDIGIWSNFCQAFGTWNVLAWLWPFARNMSVESGLAFEHNEIDDPSKPWPPPDPDRTYRAPHVSASGEGFTQSLDPDDFRRRQEADYQRYDNGELVVRRKPFHERYEHLIDAAHDDDSETVYSDDDEAVSDVEEVRGRLPAANAEGEQAWRNKEGERLADFGLDEEAEFYDEDDLPLAEIIRRRKGE
nr:hypothetical protein B0A51_17151 [Rachicladosporium sp. CCFEE 5018]